MRRIAFLLVTVATVAGVVAHMALASGEAEKEAAPIFLTEIPQGYRGEAAEVESGVSEESPVIWRVCRRLGAVF
jgi:hypothetical protein